MDDADKTKKSNPYRREIRCPIHNKLIGKYDARDGLINTTFYCPLCKREYTFTIKKDQN
jgi:phage FluMu protein Com